MEEIFLTVCAVQCWISMIDVPVYLSGMLQQLQVLSRLVMGVNMTAKVLVLSIFNILRFYDSQ